MKWRLPLAVSLWGWLLFAAWLSYDYAEYNEQWIVHIFRPSGYYEIYGFHVLIFLVPFVYTFLGYLVNEREKLLFKLKESEERFRALSLQDDLTNLHNRRGFIFLAEQLLKMAARNRKEMLLLFVDVDNMKWINDKRGHQAGDNALIDTAAILRMHVRKSDVVARIGGDEFVAIMNDPSDAFPGILCEHLEESLQSHNEKGMRGYNLSFSIGFARYDPAFPCSLEDLIDQADKNMYRQKSDKNDDAS